jgi:Ca2+-binding RTX toxin-like protein
MTTIDLTTLTATQGFTIKGDATGDQAAISVSSAGDFNGDGIDDFLVGAQFNDDGGTDSGSAYVIFGNANGLGDVDLSALSPDQGIELKNVVGPDHAGASVSSAGDINGDGFADLIVGAPFSDVGPNGGNGGAAYVILGSADTADINLTNATTTNTFIVRGAAGGDLAGTSVSSAGDINGDGFDDYIIGARLDGDGGTRAGKSYVLFGKAEGLSSIDLNTLSSTDGFSIQGAAAEAQSGTSVSSAGDINGDGFADIIVGSPLAKEGSTSNVGAAFVLFGKATGFANIDLASLSSTDGFTIHGDASGDLAGTSAASAGDVNGDRFTDMIVGAPSNDAGGNGAGAAYVLFGKAGGFGDVDLTSLSASDGFKIQGAAASDAAGTSVSSAGDVNGDGFNDVIIGTPGNGDGPGKAYVVFGKADGLADIDLASLSDDDGFAIQGKANGDKTGTSVSTAGDVNGDSIGDLIVGAPFGDDSETDSGEAYVIFGTRPSEAVTRIGSAASQAIFGGDFDDSLSGLGGNDTLNGGAGDDTLIGGTGDDTYVVDSAADVVTENVAEGTDTVKASLSFTLGDNVENLVLSGSGKLSGNGNALDNEITGNAGNNVLDGLDGKDTLLGGLGNDTLDGGRGADHMEGGAGNDVYVVDNRLDEVIENKDGGTDLVRSSVDFSLAGRAIERLTLTGNGNIEATGNGLDNILTGNLGNNDLDGGKGADRMSGGAGNDTYLVDNASDSVIEKTGGGNDLVKASVSFSFGGQAIEKLILTGKASIDGAGNGLDNAITGNAGRNVLEGLGGNDRLDGGDGNDHLFGGSGGDHLLGGAGRDTFVFNAVADSTIAKNGRDTIGDFSHAQHDHIDLSAIDAEVGKGNQDFHFIADAVFSGTAGELRFTQSHGDTIVQGDVNGDGKADFAITVESVTHLIAGDFVL